MDYYFKQIQDAFESHAICAILGPRQCGKTTLSKQYGTELSNVHFFDLEHPQDLSMLDNPSITLPPLEGLIIIDEIQRKPELFQYLRFLVDNYDKKILILGSASQEFIRQSSETLAGRIAYIAPPLFSATK